MDTFHVISLVPSPGKAIVLSSTFASRILAEVRVQPVIVQSMGLTFMSEQACIRRESEILAILPVSVLTKVWFEVRIQVFASFVVRVYSAYRILLVHLRIDALLLGGLMATRSISKQRAVIVSIFIRSLFISGVIPGLDFVRAFILRVLSIL
jgi:hypothetical protein